MDPRRAHPDEKKSKPKSKLPGLPPGTAPQTPPLATREGKPKPK